MSSITIPEGFSREDLLACADREIRMRERVYPDRIAMAKMTAQKAREEIGAMRAIRAVLAQLPATPKPQGDLFGGGRK